MTTQRYVSNELFHFTGKGKSKNEQYILFKKILDKCTLGTADSGDFSFETDSQLLLSSNEIFTQRMVCFCDIPIVDLKLHIKKYSPFGISFLKKYLLPQGVTPIWYISKKSVTHPRPTSKTLEDTHNKMYKIFDRFETLIHESAAFQKGWKQQDINDFKTLWTYFESHVFPFMKFYDESKTEIDKENFYMEREWRLMGSLHFENITNINSVVLPRSFAERFREDFQNYTGQVIFADS